MRRIAGDLVLGNQVQPAHTLMMSVRGVMGVMGERGFRQGVHVSPLEAWR